MMNKGKYVGFLFLIIAIGFILRTYNLGTFSIWEDEKISICIANGISRNNPLGSASVTQNDILQKNTIENVVSSTATDNGNCIAYNILLHTWSKTFGNSDGSIRFLSVLASFLLLFVAAGFTNDLIGSRKVTLLSLLFIAFHSLLMAYSHQARAYALGSFFTLLSSWFFIKLFLIEKKPTRTFPYYAGYIIFGALSLLTHYLTICIFIAHAIIILLFTKRNRSWLFFTLAGVSIGLLVGIWFYFGGLDGYRVLNSQNLRYARDVVKFKPGEDTFIMPTSVRHVFTGIMQVWLQLFGNMMQLLKFRIREVAITLLIPLSIIGIAWWRSKDPAVRRKILILVVLTFTQTLFATFLAIKSGHCISFQPLYSIFVVPYAMILLAYSFILLFNSDNRNIKGLAYGFFAIWIGIMCLSWYPVLTDKKMGKPARESNPYTRLAGMVSNSYSQGDTLVAPLPKDIYLLNLYLNSDKQVIQKTDSNVLKKFYLIRSQQKDTVMLMDMIKIQY